MTIKIPKTKKIRTNEVNPKDRITRAPKVVKESNKARIPKKG